MTLNRAFLLEAEKSRSVCVKAFALHSFAFFYNILLYFIMMCIIIFKNNYM